jgi:hypothetical protein
MKILLFGEFSGFFNCLKDGLIALGHDVFMASGGDGLRDFPSDFRWDSHFSLQRFGKFAPYYNAANIYSHKKLFSGYDVVLLISPNHISRFTWLNKPIYDYLINNNKKVFLSGSGDTCIMFNYWYNSDTKYKEYYKGYLIDDKNSVFLSPKKLAWEEELMNKITGYIPIWYEYMIPYQKYKNCKRLVRIPVNVSQFKYKPNQLHNGKVVFYHGITRACKGTRFIKPAFEKMKKHFNDKAEFICAEKLPFKDYMKVVERTNVIVDDANSYSIAMNGLFSLSKGKLIMGGAEPVANQAYGFSYNPVFNINPDIDQICETMIDIINRKDEIEELGLLGRRFVEEYHNHVDIAKQYIEIFNESV